MSTKNPGPVYPNLKPWDLEPHLTLHRSAMTTEGLHAKSAIAEQLAWRDQKLERVQWLLYTTLESLNRRDLTEDQENWLIGFKAEKCRR